MSCDQEPVPTRAHASDDARPAAHLADAEPLALSAGFAVLDPLALVARLAPYTAFAPSEGFADDEGLDSDEGAQALVTERLCLTVVTLPEATASATGALAALAALTGVRVPPDWPPPDTTDAKPGFRDAIRAHPEAPGWWGGFHIILTSPEPGDGDGDGDEPILIGGIGFKGPPGPDGVCELGYSLIRAFHRRGYASEAARALVAWAFFHGDVGEVAAEALPTNAGSLAVMRRCGMTPRGPGHEPGTVRLAVTRQAFQRCA